MVMWNVSWGQEGLRGLKLWLDSLKPFLMSSSTANVGSSKSLHTVIVVGTHSDISEKSEAKRPEREEEVKGIQVECGMTNIPLCYIEVSCKTGDDISFLREKIETTALDFFGEEELVPKNYLRVESEIISLGEEKRELPIADLRTDFRPRMIDITEDELERALEFHHAWGTCVYLGKSFPNIVVVDPAFLSHHVLDLLFQEEHVGTWENGKLPHRALKWIWPESYPPHAEFLVRIMECFDICFELDDHPTQLKNDFWERKSVVAKYLPEEPTPDDFTWAEECPQEASEVQRVYSFNILPKQLVSRLLVRLHRTMREKCLWRTGLFLESKSHNFKVFIRSTIETNIFEVTTRGASVPGCESILGKIEKEIVTVISQLYPGVTFSSEGRLIRKTPPWLLRQDDSWTTQSGISTRDIVKEGQIIDEELGGLLEKAVTSLGSDIASVEEACCVSNPNSDKMFEGYRANLASLHHKSPDLLKKDHSTHLRENQENRQARRDTLQHLRNHLRKHWWNQEGDGSVEVCFMAQGLIRILPGKSPKVDLRMRP